MIKKINKKEILTEKDYLKLKQKALDLINQYHINNVDKGGNPYINHLSSVSDKCYTYESKIAALLHDIIEDTDCSEDILLKEGIPEFIVKIIILVTRKENETYNEFIDRIIKSKNKYAIEVKYSDIIDNCDLTRVESLDKQEFIKIKKMIKNRYVPALKRLEEEINNNLIK